MEFTTSGHLVVRITRADVGKRVSVRTLTGAREQSARFTDTVGVLTSWTGGVLSVARRDGRVVRLAEADLVAGKVVPPTPARRRGVPAASARELTLVAARGWSGPDVEEVGGWLARACGGWTRRANSAVPLGGSRPDLDRLGAWYAARGLPLALQVTTGADGSGELLASEFEELGWAAGGHSTMRVAALAPLADAAPDDRVTVDRELTDDWLAGSPRAAEAPEAARSVLAGGQRPLFGVARAADGRVAGVGRCVVDGRWAGFAAIRVDPAHRRAGLATALMRELARAALAEGASAAYLQVEVDNAPARRLYDALGFADHHHYHYRTAPDRA
ncbi:GNAT family N-acetyltransferase [Streptomyces sp. 8K308]|uniref:GNAT family N-acetyltransferase n=1 Tax=Streptomyces sp. 8K308 TaxID=2530388 RepID=UPI001053272E|nr:GNAT family N-acetyltransferase [Streptomyces sp. 8K308]TDC11364.1 GNAT family N-acetyltransferase [Streptomyces sp. 8K308]